MTDLHYWQSLPTEDDAAAFLALSPAERGRRLYDMTESRRTAWALVIARREGGAPYRVMERFDAWRRAYLDTLAVAR
jgi:hypothetical protein